MQIRPLDMQVMVPKLQEIANMKQLENQKAALNQSEIANTQEKMMEKHHQSVNKSDEEKNLRNDSDAKDKGSNEYSSNKKKSSQKSEQPEDAKNTQETRNRIDIRI